MPLTFNQIFEKYENHHSFLDLLNLCKEVSDYIYNNDIINSQFFRTFKEVKDGFVINFGKSEKTNYIVYSDKKKVTDDKGNDVLLDRAYEDIETLYDILQYDERLINIKQIDEKIKTFGELFEDLTRDELDPYSEEDWDDVNYRRVPEAERIFTELGMEYRYDPNDDKYICSKGNIDFTIYHIPVGAYNVSYKVNNPKNPNYMWNSDDFNTMGLEDSLREIIRDHLNENKISKMKTFKEIIPEEPINEAFQDEIEPKLSNKYMSLKRGILELLDRELNGDITKLQNYIDNFVDPESEEVLDGFVEDADIFDFYLKYQADIDQILLDHKYYDDLPEVESLYDYVIDGTFDAVVYCMEEMKEELYSE